MHSDDFPTVEQRNARQLATVFQQRKEDVDARFASLETRLAHVEQENRELRQQLVIAAVAGRGSGPTS